MEQRYDCNCFIYEGQKREWDKGNKAIGRGL